MERIKLAIEKAKKTASVSQLSSDSIEQLVDCCLVKEGSLEEISYSNTDVVELDAAHLQKNRIVAHNKNNPNSCAFDILRTQILQKMDESGWRTLAVTSPLPEAGKTVVAINLAMSIAYQTQRTCMLVDFDLRRPRVESYLGIKRDISLNEVLSGEANIAAAMINPNIPRLVVLPTSRPMEKSSEVLSSSRVSNLIADLRERYQDRIVIFNLSPILAADDAMAILPKIDCSLLVVGNGKSSQREVKDSLRHLPEANLLGVVLNGAESSQPKKHY